MPSRHSAPRAISGQPPVFPEWMRRLDPVLAAEDTNVIYQAFRARRAEHSASFNARLHASKWAYFATCTLGSAAGGTVLYVLFRPLGVWTLVFSILLAAMIPSLYFAVNRMSSYFPRRALEIMEGVAMRRNIAEDLWLAGARGGELVESAYLEMREVSARTTPPCAAFLGGIAALCAGIWAVWNSSLVAAALLSGSVLYLTWSLIPRLLISDGERILRWRLAPEVAIWSDDGWAQPLAKFAVRTVARAMRMGLLAAPFVLAPLAVVFCVTGILLSDDDTGGVATLVRQNMAPLAVSLSLVIGALLARQTLPARSKRLADEAEALFSRADEAWPKHFERIMKGDLPACSAGPDESMGAHHE